MYDRAVLGLEDEAVAGGEIHDCAAIDLAVIHKCHGFA